ncbi:MAG: YHS domain-containing (seleno)protein [Chitinophagaceae bacterium]
MKQLLSLVLFTTIASGIFAQAEQRKKHFNINDKQVAISGYDAVAYFTQNKSVEGKSELAVAYQGVVYYFSTAENKELFKKNPSKYEPQYGGWCAYAMGNDGSKVEVDPKTFKILDGKLYLFYNKFFTNTLKSWNKNETVLQQNADANWLKTYKP